MKTCQDFSCQVRFSCRVVLVEYTDEQVLQFIKFSVTSCLVQKLACQVHKYEQVHLTRKIFNNTRASKTCQGKTCYRKLARP